jgi:hypothetical protein
MTDWTKRRLREMLCQSAQADTEVGTSDQPLTELVGGLIEAGADARLILHWLTLMRPTLTNDETLQLGVWAVGLQQKAHSIDAQAQVALAVFKALAEVASQETK